MASIKTTGRPTRQPQPIIQQWWQLGTSPRNGLAQRPCCSSVFGGKHRFWWITSGGGIRAARRTLRTADEWYQYTRFSLEGSSPGGNRSGVGSGCQAGKGWRCAAYNKSSTPGVQLQQYGPANKKVPNKNIMLTFWRKRNGSVVNSTLKNTTRE